MSKFAYVALANLCWLTCCSGNVSNDAAQSGGTLAIGGSANTSAGASNTGVGGSSTATGGAPSVGGFMGLGGTLPASGGTSTHASNTGGFSGVNCAAAGCAPPPLCSTGCTAVCGCCLCSDGVQQGTQICRNGCWAELGTGGASSADTTASSGGKFATGGIASSGGIPNSGGSLSTLATNVCGTGCTFETTDSPFCTKGLASLYCQGSADFQAISSQMQRNGCTVGASDAVRFCCPSAILSHCQ